MDDLKVVKRQSIRYIEVKAEMAGIKKMVDEMYVRPFIPTPMVTKFMHEVKFENIWAILESKEEHQEKKKKKNHWSAEKEAMKDSLQSESDWQVRVKEMEAGTSSSRSEIVYVKGDSDVAPLIDVPLITLAITGAIIVEIVPAANGTIVDDSGTQFEGLHNNKAIYAGALSTHVCS